jgi:hypothetical protein
MRKLVCLSILAACTLLLPRPSGAQIPAPDWDFIMEAGQGGPTLPGGVEVNLDDLLNGGLPFASIPSGATLDVYALIENYDTSGLYQLLVTGANLGTAAAPAEIDLSGGLFELEGKGFPSWVGLLVPEGEPVEVLVGTLDVTGFLSGLPEDGSLHEGNAMLSVSGAWVNVLGIQGPESDVTHDPVLTVKGARVNPGGGPQVPEPGSLAMLGALILGGGGILLRRKA